MMDRKTKLRPKELAEKSDIVIICVPISATIKTIREIRDFIRQDALLCDFTSFKEEMLKTKSNCGVTGIHPLFGPLATNLNKQVIVFCSGRDNYWTKFLKKLFKDNGATVVFIDSKKHDYQVAIIQALTHFINIAFIKTLQNEKLKLLNIYSAPIFRLQTILAGRVLGGNPELYVDLEMENSAFLKILAHSLKEVKKIASYIKKEIKRILLKVFKNQLFL